MVGPQMNQANRAAHTSVSKSKNFFIVLLSFKLDLLDIPNCMCRIWGKVNKEKENFT